MRIKTNLGKIMSTVTTRTATPQLLNSWTESEFDPRPLMRKMIRKNLPWAEQVYQQQVNARERGLRRLPNSILIPGWGKGRRTFSLSFACASSFCFNSDDVIKQIKSFYPEANSPKPIDFIALLLFRASTECRFSVRLLAASVTGDLPSFRYPPAILPLLLS